MGSSRVRAFASGTTERALERGKEAKGRGATRARESPTPFHLKDKEQIMRETGRLGQHWARNRELDLREGNKD